MHSITIREIRKEGELRWGIVLIDEENRPILESVDLLDSGSALATAKALKHKGSDTSVWREKDGELQFTLAPKVRFRFLGKQEGTTDIHDVIKILTNFRVKAEIKWDPPDADPAHRVKQADLTPTKGIAGS